MYRVETCPLLHTDNRLAGNLQRFNIRHCRDKATSFEKLSGDHDCRPQLLEERCTQCGACLIACRDGGYQAISWNGGPPEIDQAACTACSLCSHVCPTGAISMESLNEEVSR